MSLGKHNVEEDDKSLAKRTKASDKGENVVTNEINLTCMRKCVLSHNYYYCIVLLDVLDLCVKGINNLIFYIIPGTMYKQLT